MGVRDATRDDPGSAQPWQEVAPDDETHETQASPGAEPEDLEEEDTQFDGRAPFSPLQSHLKPASPAPGISESGRHARLSLGRPTPQSSSPQASPDTGGFPTVHLTPEERQAVREGSEPPTQPGDLAPRSSPVRPDHLTPTSPPASRSPHIGFQGGGFPGGGFKGGPNRGSEHEARGAQAHLSARAHPQAPQPPSHGTTAGGPPSHQASVAAHQAGPRPRVSTVPPAGDAHTTSPWQRPAHSAPQTGSSPRSWAPPPSAGHLASSSQAHVPAEPPPPPAPPVWGASTQPPPQPAHLPEQAPSSPEPSPQPPEDREAQGDTQAQAQITTPVRPPPQAPTPPAWGQGPGGGQAASSPGPTDTPPHAPPQAPASPPPTASGALDAPAQRSGAHPSSAGPASVRPPAAVSSSSAQASRAAARIAMVGAAVIVMFGVTALVAWSVLQANPEAGPSAVVAAPTPRTPAGAPPPLPDLAGPVPNSLPQAPFVIPPPQPFGAEAFATLAVGEVVEAERRERQSRQANQWEEAAAWSDRATRLDGSPSLFFKNAASLAQAGEVEAGLYWLVRAIDEVGLEPQRLTETAAFASLWSDPRWPALAQWAVDRARYFRANHQPRLVAWLPGAPERTWRLADDSPLTEAPTFPGSDTIVWLAPSGTDHTFIEPWASHLADALNAPVVAIDPPRGVGPHAGTWTSDLLRDRGWVDEALGRAVADRRATRNLIFIGSGRSGRVAIDMALRNPSSVKGVIALSPEPAASDKLDPAVLAIYDRDQRALLVSGAEDKPMAAAMRAERARMVRAGLDADLRIEDEAWYGPVPPSLPTRIAGWLGEFRSGMSTPRFPDQPPTASVLPPAPRGAAVPEPPASPEAPAAAAEEDVREPPADDAPAPQPEAPLEAEANTTPEPQVSAPPEAPSDEAPERPAAETQPPTGTVNASPLVQDAPDAPPTPSSDPTDGP